MIHKHELRTAISDLRQALELIEHYSGRPEVFCLKQLLVNPLAYLLTENIIRAKQGESPVTSHNSASAQFETMHKARCKECMDSTAKCRATVRY